MQSSAPYRTESSSGPKGGNAPADADRCPFLGTLGDPNTSLEFVSDTHRCFTTHFPVPVSSIHQDNYCLSPNFAACPVYQRQANRTEAPLMPLTALGAGGAGLLAWPETAAVGASATAPVAGMSAAATTAVSAAVEMAPAAASSGLEFRWEQPTHPDFQNDMEMASSRRQSSGINPRLILYGLLLLALIPLGWWLWGNIGAGSRTTPDSVQGSIVTMPTLMASSAEGESSSNGGDSIAGVAPGGVADATPEGGESGAAVVPVASPTPNATATPSDLERIAATATALFANATPITECVAPSWWVSYVVEEGDTIEALAAARGMLPEEVIVPNCLAGPDLEPGMTLLLPPVGVIAVQTDLPTATSSPTASPTRPTRAPIFPTRGPIFVPTFAPPTVIVIITPDPPTEPPGDDDGPGQRPTQPPSVPTSAAQSTATPPNPFPTATPPGIGATATPPSIGGPEVTPTRGTPTSTPPSPPTQEAP